MRVLIVAVSDPLPLMEDLPLPQPVKTTYVVLSSGLAG
jgi:hypothetical protein